MANVQLIVGGGTFLDDIGRPSLETVKYILDKLQEKGVKSIDTATIYDNSEELLGQAHAADCFAVSTKYPGGFLPQPGTNDTLLACAEDSLAKLQTGQVRSHNILCTASLGNLLDGMNDLHRDGKIKRFGISNLLLCEVEEVIRIRKEKGYMLPSVYQGNYSALARHVETELLPTLRKHNIAFYAYSPIAGGFLTKDVEELRAGDHGRWDPSSVFRGFYNALYKNPAMREGLSLWPDISSKSNIPKAELAYRWVVYNSRLSGEFGDAIVFGPRNLDQLTQTLDGLKNGPLSAAVAAQIEEVWKLVENVSA
ncbi:hypothetical protein N7540_006073 [Penicillium herquei]|nr:hypothetical protein N7540_006073 [Penicillium herquei]